MDALKQGLTELGVNYTETRFRSGEGINGINKDIFVSCLITCPLQCNQLLFTIGFRMQGPESM